MENFRRILILLCIILLTGCQSYDTPVEQKSTPANNEADSQINKEEINKEEINKEEINKEEKNNEEIDNDIDNTNPVPADTSFDMNLVFAGDINLDENWATTEYYNAHEQDITQCISQDLIDEMTAADITWINNEFTYSTRGEPLPGKAYVFRANPDNVSVLETLGVDIAGLANNHVWDYGEEAFLDTMDTLNQAGIAYVGAGHNLSEASAPLYVDIQGKTVAYVAASRAEKYKMTPQAGEDTPGILRCYDTDIFLEEIRKARENADYVIALVHWGTEYSYTLEDVQIETGHAYIDAGADIVIGAHTHCIQGMEYYQGKPIIYSLGNFWFNDKTLDAMLIKVNITGDDSESKLAVQVIPALQTGCTTTKINDLQKQEELYTFIEEISENIGIDDNGRLQ